MDKNLRPTEHCTPFYLCTAQENACLILKVPVIYFLLCLMSDEKKPHTKWEYLKILTLASS